MSAQRFKKIEISADVVSEYFESQTRRLIHTRNSPVLPCLPTQGIHGGPA